MYIFQKDPNLQYTTVFPRRVTSSRMAQNALSLQGGEGKAVLLGGFGEASLLLDFDEEIVGGLIVEIACEAPARVRINYDEEAELAQRNDPLACSWYKLVYDEYELEAGKHTLISKGRRGFRFVSISVQSEEDVTVYSVSAENGTHPLEQRGLFRCSDERLNRIWDISAATAKACMQNFYEDGVKRDGLLWIGDYRITFLSAYYLTGDAALARKSLLMIRDSQYECGALPACSARGGATQHGPDAAISYMPNIPGDGQNKWVILNYMCDYILSIEEYVRLTGDASILPEIVPSAVSAAKFLLSLIDLETPGKWYIDDYLSKRDSYGLNYTILTDCTMNPKNCFSSKGGLLLQYLASLRTLSSLAAQTDDTASAEWARELADRLDAHIEEHYYTPVRGQYLDQKRQKFCDISQYTTPYAILAGKEDEIGMQRMMRSVMPALGFAMAWRIEASFMKGFTREALRDISSAWGKMLDADSRTCWERLDVPEMNATHYYDASGSFCHGWTSSPAWQLPSWIVGIRPEADGFRKITVTPNLDLLDFAEATVPTKDGDITARVERDGKNTVLYLSLPASVEECTVKWDDDHTVTVKGSEKYTLRSDE